VLALNSAICWKLLFIYRGQSAGNHMGKAYGILRGHTLKILNLKRNYSNVPNNNFNSYLTGLIEGDGCINIPKREKDNNNKHISPQIIISFNSKD
jgi:hypothetical protein